jgi:hypothetical protein
MEAISESAQAAYAMMVQNYILIVSILTLILAFAVYVYLFPKSVDFFANPEPKNIFQETGLRDKRLRSEPSENDPHLHHTPIHEAP